MGYHQQHSDRTRLAAVQHPAPSALAAFARLGGVVGCGGRAISFDLFDKAP